MGIFDRDNSDYPRIHQNDPLAADNPHLVRGHRAPSRWGTRPADPEPERPSRWGKRHTVDANEGDDRWGRARTAGRFGRKASGAAAKTGRFLWDSGPDWK